MPEKQFAVERVGIKPEDLDSIVVEEPHRRRMHALTPIDGRYNRYVEGLPTSEFEWTKRRIWIETEYVIALAEELERYEGPERKVVPRAFTTEERDALRSLYKDFDDKDFRQIQVIDRKTKHDIVAMVRWIDYKLKRKDIEMDVEGMGLEEAIHFARTSADINTNVYNTVVRDIMMGHYVPTLCDFMDQLVKMGDEWGLVDGMEVEFAAQTHGQFAEYTTLRKVIANIADAVAQGADDLMQRTPEGRKIMFQLPGKMGGAVGNDDDLRGAYPNHDWRNFHRLFVEGVIGLKFEPMCDQDEFNVQNTKLYDAIVRVNDVIIKMCDDMWEYMSRGVFRKMVKAGESGSSVMAQKANPWLLEGGWEFLEESNGSFQRFHRLMQYKRQGDLRRSARKRWIGIPFAEAIIGMKRIMQELANYTPNYEAIDREIEGNDGMLAAYVQTCLKREGIGSAYDEIKAISMGKKVGVHDYNRKLDEFVARGMLKEDVCERIKKGILTPVNRTGYAKELAGNALEAADQTASDLRKTYERTIIAEE